MDANNNAGEITQELVAWITQALPETRVSAVSLAKSAIDAGAADGIDGAGVDVRLVGAAPRSAPLTAGRKRAVLALDYLVTIRLADPIAEHRAMSDLAFAALNAADIELATERSVADVCRTNGLPPQTGLLLRTEARQETLLAQAPLVRHPPNMQLAPLVQAEGMVTGPDSRPIPGALITLAGSNRVTTTGPDGRFRIAIPEGSTAQATARAKSRDVSGPLNPGSANIFPLPMEA